MDRIFLPLAGAGAFAALGAAAAWAAPAGDVRVQVFDQRGLPVRDAVVEIDSSAAHGARVTFPWRAAMAQKNLTFTPGTLIVAKGSNVAFPNLDQVRHSVYSFSKPARFTIELYGRDQSRMHPFPIAGAVALGCNIHDTMRGYIRVVDTPHAAKTDANGVVNLRGVPAGSARITVWHPQMRAPNNESAKSVVLAGGASAQKLTVTIK